MADLSKAEKLAAAKKRVELLKKKKGNIRKVIDSEVKINPDSVKITSNATTPSSPNSNSEDEVIEETETCIKDQTLSGELCTDVKHGMKDYLLSDPNTLLAQKSVTPETSTSDNCDSIDTVDDPPIAVVTTKSEGTQDNDQSFMTNRSQYDLIKTQVNHRADSTLESSLDTTQTHVSHHHQPESEIRCNKFDITPPLTHEDHKQVKDSLDTNISIQNIPDHEIKNDYSLELYQRAQRFEKECIELRSRLIDVEKENNKLRRILERSQSSEDFQVLNDDDLDILENEKHEGLLKKIRDLEKEISELRQGTFRDSNIMPSFRSSTITSPGTKFTEVDLGATNSPKRNVAHDSRERLSNFLTSGLNAITGANINFGDEAALLQDDDTLDFDEETFKLAQEEETKFRLERIKEVKRSLKSWEGWRLDLVEIRGHVKDGVGIVFEL